MATPNEQALAQALRKVQEGQKSLRQQLASMKAEHDGLMQALADKPHSITEEIDSIAGRRIFYNLVGAVSFTAAQDGRRGEPVVFTVSQDGPFVATHYPVVAWKPNAPTSATNFGQWSPIYSYPVPTQQVTLTDIIDISYEFVDSGSQRNFQNQAAPPMLSRFDNAIPLPCPTLFAPASVINFFPTYESIFFANTEVDTTGGLLVVKIPGYRIVNL